ncbi:MAG TPA: hypothetical protein VFS67_33285 [Polyangiaceae bacterium]|nr:hypothetical protein [Polyangiaceae bacterium]
MAGLIRALCSQGVRRGVRVVAEDKRGHIFFDQGHVVHAEFGEDVGLGAVIEMLHSGSVEFRPCARPWPSQPSLFFTAEKLLAAARPGAMNALTGVRRKPDPEPAPDSASSAERPVFHDPPPLPEAEQEPTRADHPRPEPAPLEPTLAAKFAPLDAAVSELSRAVAAAAAVHRSSAVRATRAASASTARVPAAPAAVKSAPRSVSTVKPASAPAAAPPPADTAPSSSATPGSGTAAASSPAATAPASAPAAAPAPAASATASLTTSEREASSPPRQRSLPVTWTRRTLPRPLANDEPPTSRRRPELATSMVRVSGRGVLLAARGEECERLANAAAFIHNQAKLIAADLGRHGRTAVHLKGGGLSLLVVKSEVNDIAAALGPTERLRSLLRKVGLG